LTRVAGVPINDLRHEFQIMPQAAAFAVAAFEFCVDFLEGIRRIELCIWFG
jgi:hypothetical protein